MWQRRGYTMIRRWGMFVFGKYTVEDMIETFDDSLGKMGFKREDSDDSTIILWKPPVMKYWMRLRQPYVRRDFCWIVCRPVL